MRGPRLLRWFAMAAGAVLTTALLAAAAVCLGSGCSTLGYYGQAVQGHLDLLGRSRPVQQWLDEPDTPPALRERLQLSQRMRDFAVTELRLPNNNSYRRYADLQRNAVVWNVVAAPELSLQLKTWCFAVMGCVGYRGYFDRQAAERLGAELRGQGWEVSVYGVPAYSTLGWTNWLGGDPLLNTFVHGSEADLARVIFHELAHQVAYARDDTTFNESFATAVERIGGERWLQRHATPEQRAQVAQTDRRRAELRALMRQQRQRLAEAYAAGPTDDARRAAKAEAMAQLRRDHERIKRERWDGFAGYDAYLASANNATFAVQAAYNELVPDFERLFERLGGDFDRFYAEVRRLAALPRDERRAALARPTPQTAAETAAAPPR